jgi:hypothetical protein
MYSCNEITALLSQGADIKLNFFEDAAVKLHLFTCASCRSYQIQSETVRKSTRRFSDHAPKRWVKDISPSQKHHNKQR